MLYHLFDSLQDQYSYLRVFGYISFRLFMGILTSLALGLLIGEPFIAWLRKLQSGASNVREDVPESHLKKSGTPTMGGLMILLCSLSSFFLWGRLDVLTSWTIILTSILFSILGFMDDWSKVKKVKNGGLRSFAKLKLQIAFAVLISSLLFFSGFESSLYLPFFKSAVIPLGWLFIPFGALVIVSASNAVNLTDGLDGLAIGPALVAFTSYIFFSYIAGNIELSSYLQLPYIHHAGELTVFCGTMLGAGLSFLWFNTYPAQVFMGDVGSLAIGAVLGSLALMVKQEILLIVVGGVFVLETLSVVIQVISFRATGKRVFRMAPLHHHFELKGWAEPKVIVRFWIISIVLALVSLASLKLR
ncbi:MAG: phospho-N-acetylmuramoyl-pentapeptide-transferase [Bdellovibrionales bacterium]|nr:phospho-N-acetylmuramoyl-pentapeptide-transferase [Bdellovibrionales bacterium]